jgi:hypothetical protein
MRKLFAVTGFALLVGAAAQAVTIQQNTAFPEMNAFLSQTNWNSQLGLQDRIINGTITNDLSIGQSFKLDAETTLRAITFQNHQSRTWNTNTTHELELWIGGNDGTASNFVAGATSLLTTIDLAGQTLGADFVTFNLDADLVLPAGNYGFQLNWTTQDAANFMYAKRIDGGSTYTNGGWLYDTTIGGTLPFDDADTPILNDLVFGLHSAPVGTIPTFSVNPDNVEMILIPPYNLVTGAVEVAFTADSTMDIAVSISEESNPGSISVLSVTPQTISTNTLLDFEFDNTIANLVEGQSATGLITIAWNETGSTMISEVVLPIIAYTGFVGTNNNFTALGDGVHWGDPANWDQLRVPGALAKDTALIQSESAVTVATNFFAPFSWDMTIRNFGTLNIDADLSNGGDLRLGNNAGHIGYVNQTAGEVDVTSLSIGEAAGTAPSNSVYNMTGGSVDTDTLTIFSTGELNLNGGSMNVETSIALTSNGVFNIDGGSFTFNVEPANRTLNNAGSLIKVQSGSFNTYGPNGNDVLNCNVDLEISGGTVDMGGQNKFSNELRIIGDAATIAINNFNSPVGGAIGDVVYVMGETGISTIVGSGFSHLQQYTITVDGSSYVGSTATFVLLDSGNLASTSTAVSVTGFAPGVTAVVTQDQGTDEVTLTITVPGFGGWIAGYGLSGSPDADADYDYDGDGEDNFYEYALGGNPTNIAIKGFVPTGEAVEDGGTTYFEYVYARRIGTETELDYQPLFGTDLVYTNWSSAAVVELPITGILDVDYESVTNQVDTTGIPTGFMELLIEQL